MKFTKYIGMAALTLPMAAAAQNISFETEDYKAIGVYDTWEESPFRNGPQKLRGNAKVVDNPQTDVDDVLGYAPNATAKVLAVQRSRFGSNTFGARIDLKETFELTTRTRYVHVYMLKPVEGRVMLVGLGKSNSINPDPNTLIPDSYEMPRNVLDFSISKTIGRYVTLTLAVKDILSEDIVYKQFPTFVKDGQTYHREQVTRRYNPGQNVMLTVSAKF